MALAGFPVRQYLSARAGRVLRHLVLWGLFVGYEYAVFSQWQESPLVTWGFVVKDTLATVAGFYFFSLVMLPRWLLGRRWGLTLLGIVGIYYGWALLSYAYYALLDAHGLISKDAYSYMHRFLDGSLWQGVFSWRSVSMGLSDFVVTVVPPILLRFIQFLLRSSNRSLHLQRENLHLEVNFLKAQVNPHFLFNTLNNLYLMVVKQDERAPDMVQHLAHLMHYTVYEAEAALVPLRQELGFLEAYLELERLRYGQKVSIRYQPPTAGTHLLVTPLLFFPFVENAFKHGVDSSLDASWVTITLDVVGQELRFAVRNSFSPGAPERAFGGVGIANVRKRLALHYAPQDYQLTITQDPDAHTYAVNLTLHLTSAPVPAALLTPASAL
ncbi:histidine kinase [Hymenobacter sp. J193]|uniref:sensor histidine kinase n=1 Tax=Hymenobacter sp. J193 TaxID=2898429 RepID=UPI002150D747|nr:histidine kinase [Hymenobacter sp. J193]MCR5886288.1 histidine kinase [Hymenobacter sp. J193]